LELNKVFKELLASNKYVSLPGFGSFVQSYQPAKLSADGKSFLPPNQSITFDPSRSFDDEVLSNYLQDKLGVDHHEAEEKVKDYIESVKTQISKGNEVIFPSVGRLTIGENGEIAFHEADDLEKISSTFGLKEIKVEEKESFAQKSKAPKNIVAHKPRAYKKSIKIPSTNILLIGIAAAIAVVVITAFALVLFIPDFRYWEDQQAQVTSSLFNESTLKESNDIENITFTEDEIDSFVDDGIATTTEHEDVVDIVSDKKKALYYEEPKQQDSKTYYIIAGSFERIENAQTLFSNLSEKGHNPDILQSDGRFRVAMSKFTDRNRALRELDRLRNEKPHESVWLLGL